MRVRTVVLGSLVTVIALAGYASAQPSSVSQVQPQKQKVAVDPATQAISSIRALTPAEKIDRLKLQYKGVKEADLQAPFGLTAGNPTKVGPGPFIGYLNFKSPKMVSPIVAMSVGTSSASFGPSSSGSQLYIVFTGAANTGYLIDIVANAANGSLVFDTSFENAPQTPQQTVSFQSPYHAGFVVMKQAQGGRVEVIVKNTVDWTFSKVEVTPFN